MTDNTQKDIKKKAVKAALACAAEKGWAQTSLYDIADKADIPLAQLFDVFDDRHDVLAAYGRYVDRRVMEAVPSGDSGMPVRDRLFDIMMERFDVLNEDRDGVISILKTFRFDPKEALISAPHLGKSMSWMLEASGEQTQGISGCLKIAGLCGLYLKALKTWVNDDSPDMGKTMAALDKSLGKAERWGSSFGLI